MPVLLSRLRLQPSTRTARAQASGQDWQYLVRQLDPAVVLGTFDVAVALRWLASSAVAIGCMGFLENAGQSAFVDVPSSRTPFWLFSGPQFLIEPYLGVQFGP
jgi:hypothetical protein